MEAAALEKTDVILEKWRPQKGNLIMILHEVENTYGYILRKAGGV